MLSVEDWAEIRRLRRSEQMPILQIVRMLGISRNMVQAALASDGPPRYQRRPSTPGGEPPVQICPECGHEALVDKVEIRSEPDLPMWVCFSCQLIQPLGGIALRSVRCPHG